MQPATRLRVTTVAASSNNHLTRAGAGAATPDVATRSWHPFRRKWATERKHHPLKYVAAGGWKNTQALLTCYQQPDEDTLRRVLDEPRKLRDRGLDAGSDREPAPETAP